jgi:hypothetical protein
MYIYKASACSLGVVGDWAVAWRRRQRSRMYIYEVSACCLGVASHVYLQSHTVNTPASITSTNKRPASIILSTERFVLRSRRQRRRLQMKTHFQGSMCIARNLCCCTQHVHVFKETCARSMCWGWRIFQGNMCMRNVLLHATCARTQHLHV